MIRLIICIKKKKGVSFKKFREYWNSPEFENIMDRLAALLELSRVSRKLTLQVSANIRIMQAMKTTEPYDAVIEWWFESANHLAPLLAKPEAHTALKELVKYQSRFIDFTISPSFFTEA
jgi:hypothetical protein